MSALQALGIAGFRSYSPESLQKIDFQTPLTLIWGRNGSGKTTIIEVLKYITTGALPPACDKGKNFIMDPKMVNQSEIIGDARLKFKAFNGRPVLAKRRTMLGVTTKGCKFESIEQTLKTKDEKGEMFEINHHCAEIEKQIPQLLGISKAVLENIVFCHQDESLWPFSDNANLKAIFDEMFETRKYTKIVDSFWEQHKEYSKDIKESRKAMDYLKRLYDDDNRRKRNALREMEQVSEEAEQVALLRKHLENIKLSPSSTKDANDRKYHLVMKRGSIEERVHAANRTLTELTDRIKTLNTQYKTISAVGFPERGRDGIPAIDRQLAELTSLRDELTSQLEESQNASAFTQKQMEVLGEVKRAKQCLPELKNENDEEQVLRVIQKRCEAMEGRRAELSKLRKQGEQVVLPSLLDLPLSESAYLSQKKALASETLKLEESKAQILGMYARLYRVVSPRRPHNYDTGVESRLQQTRMRLKVKREELAAYESLPEGESFHQQRSRIQYAGIQFQHTVLEFCNEKKKCFVCSRMLNEAEIRNVKGRCERNMERANRKIGELEAENNRKGEGNRVDPEQIIPVLRRDIAKAEEEEAKLTLAYEEHAAYKELSEQAKLNDKLTAILRKAGLDREPLPAPRPHASPETFQERAGEYEGMRLRVEAKGRELRLYEQRVRRNREIEQQRQTATEQAAQIRERISACEQQTQGFDILANIYKRLSTLLKSRGNRKPNSKQKSSQSEASSPQQIEQQLSAIVQQLRGLALEREYLLAGERVRQLQEEGRQLQEEGRATAQLLRAVEAELQAGRAQGAEEARLSVEYAARKREIELKATLAFQEYSHPMENEYLAKKLQLSNREAMARDLEVMCKAMEAAISAFHREKMDEVNKYLSEIWREVYHGEDISLIEVQASHVEDTKRKKSYSYSIVMEKAGGKKMEMKGRCSMGQKVLASIVIRLAIAEVFANSARILALDQPTTNLDREHIANLAHQLGRLVELNDGKYLQMIIISHDLDFIRMMEKYTSSYYEVSRDHRKFSVIKRKEIREIYAQQ